MATMLGNLRKRVFGPDPKEVLFATRGFTAPGPEQQQLFEHIGMQFIHGFAYGMESRGNEETEAKLERIERPYRGFGYEGCTMALTIRDALTPWNRTRVRTFLTGRAARHIYMAHIGIGWALGRIPQARWHKIAPRDQFLRWLSLDGYGFHQGYFKSARYLDEQYVQQSFPSWPGPQDYLNRAIDQGIGRATWFARGADPEATAALVASFAPHRQSDLWAGVGFASGYAGGADENGLKTLRAAAGSYELDLAQGAAFAAKVRHLADLVLPYHDMAMPILCGRSVQEAAAIVDEARHDLPPDGDVPAYETWRRRIRQRLDVL